MKKKIKEYNQKNDLNIEKIIDEYSGYVYQIIKNNTFGYFSKEDMEEIVSDTFFILWKNRERLNIEEYLCSYIAGITKNLIKEKRRKIEAYLDLSDYENTMKDNILVDMLYEKREEMKEIEKIVKDFKEEDQFIFNEFYYSSMKINEIAKCLNLSEFNVKTRLYRIRKKIKSRWKEGGYADESYK